MCHALGSKGPAPSDGPAAVEQAASDASAAAPKGLGEAAGAAKEAATDAAETLKDAAPSNPFAGFFGGGAVALQACMFPHSRDFSEASKCPSYAQ